MMTCRDFHAVLAAYHAGESAEAECSAIREHLSNCPCCRNYLSSFQVTIRMSRLLRTSEGTLHQCFERIRVSVLSRLGECADSSQQAS